MIMSVLCRKVQRELNDLWTHPWTVSSGFGQTLTQPQLGLRPSQWGLRMLDKHINHVCSAAFIMFVLLHALLAARAVAGQPGADLLPVQQQESLGVPLRAVGQLSNGCTGYLIGPCHVSQHVHAYHVWYFSTCQAGTNSSVWHQLLHTQCTVIDSLFWMLPQQCCRSCCCIPILLTCRS